LRFRVPTRLLLLLGMAGALAIALLAAGVKPDRQALLPPPPPPQDVSVSFNFQDGPNLVFLCWADQSDAVNFYDVGLEVFGGGQPRQEVRYGVTTFPCAGGLGTGEYLFSPDLYHFAVRACNNAGCSDWADGSPPERYWFSIPCSDPTGDACARSQDLTVGAR
jgi:hypothetical protein